MPLTEARQIPTGSEVDALHGSLKMVSNTGQVGKTQTATLTGGVFKVTQTRKGISKGLTDFNLVESAFQGAPTYATCKANYKAGDATDRQPFQQNPSTTQGQRPRQIPHHRALQLSHRPRHHLHRRRPLRRHPHPRNPRHRPRRRLRPPQDHPPPRRAKLPREETVVTTRPGQRHASDPPDFVLGRPGPRDLDPLLDRPLDPNRGANTFPGARLHRPFHSFQAFDKPEP